MKPPCRLLLIEDKRQEADAIERACCPDPSTVTFEVVTNGAQAEEALEEHEYDLVICDLALPSDERLLEPETSEGLRLFELIRERSQGTPVIILSGHADLHMMQRFFDASRDRDLYGMRTNEPLVRFFPKEDLPACIDAVKTHIARTEMLDRVELRCPPEVALALSDQRALRIYARRAGASLAVVDPLDGGLSDARTFRVSLTDSVGDTVGVVVAKLGSLRKVTQEAARYEQLGPRLPVGLGAHVLFVVDAGAGRRGALIYQLADEHTSSLFGVLVRDQPAAIAAIERLEGRMSEWAANAPVVARSLTEIRRASVLDLQLRDSGIEISDERGIDVAVRESLAHADLHGFNVLVTPGGEPTLIDYGEVRRATAALDPVTLELSVVFHPNMGSSLGSWPSTDQAKNWVDLDAFSRDCPFEGFVRACRAWAAGVAAGTEELAATAYAYSLRQVKYRNPTLPVAVAVAEGALAYLRRPVA